MARSKSSKRWLQEHHQDGFVQRARSEGYRSRAVYKLAEILHKDALLKPGQFVLDLGAAPGGWTEYASRIVGDQGRVIALDVLDMAPVAGAEVLQGDFTEQDTLDRLLVLLGDSQIDLVLSDMAPSLSGIESVDQPKAVYLAELAVDLARQYLRTNGARVVKLFQGEGFDELIAGLRADFCSVKLRKPSASRPRSREVYAVCAGLK